MNGCPAYDLIRFKIQALVQIRKNIKIIVSLGKKNHVEFVRLLNLYCRNYFVFPVLTADGKKKQRFLTVTGFDDLSSHNQRFFWRKMVQDGHARHSLEGDPPMSFTRGKVHIAATGKEADGNEERSTYQKTSEDQSGVFGVHEAATSDKKVEENRELTIFFHGLCQESQHTLFAQPDGMMC